MMVTAVPLSDFISIAHQIQRELTPGVTKEAFGQYPQNVYEKVGKEHEKTLKARLEKLPEVAAEFHALVHNRKRALLLWQEPFPG